jgi:hypothetical protein
MDDNLQLKDNNDEILKLAEFLNEPEEFHIPIEKLQGATLEALLNSFPHVTVNSYKDEIQLEIYNNIGTIFCNLKNNICIKAALFPHDDDTHKTN